MARMCERWAMTANWRVAWCVPVLALVALASACSGGGGSQAKGSKGSGGTGASSLPLTGTNWVLTDTVSLGVPLSGTSVTAQFGTDGRLAGNSGCNSYTTTYKTSGSNMSISATIAGSLVACAGATGAVEQAYLAKLPTATSFSISGSTLTLFGTGNTKLLGYRGLTGNDAVAGKWTVTGYYTGSAIQSPTVGSTLTADFAGSTVSGNGGCNMFNGPYKVSGASITIGPLASTLRACADQALDTQEQQYLAALQLAATVQPAGSRLDLLRSDGGIAVSFVRAQGK
jgi:heat shock protein HslJ